MKHKIKKILITGGAGFIGSHIADQLAVRPKTRIVILDDLSRGQLQNLEFAKRRGKIEFIRGDIRNRRTVVRALKGVDTVFHEAGLRITQCAAEPKLAFDIMAQGTFHLAEAAVREGVRKIVLASTASVYGMADQFPTKESHHPYNNRTWYGAIKALDEALFRSFHEMYGLNYVALRYFNVYGPRMDVHGLYTEVLIRWMERIRAGKPPLILGNGRQTMEFVYVEDVARANILAAESAVTDDVFNVAVGREVSLNELARVLLKVMGSTLRPEYGPERKVNPVRRRLADVSKAKKEFGFKAGVTLEDGLRRLAHWWREAR